MNTQNAVKVWDPLIRLFHWGLVLFFVISYATGEEESSLHAWSGYVIAGLLIFRLIWGFVGPRHARFSDFVFSPDEIVAYAKGLFKGDAKRYLGHNPLGGVMVIALLVSLSLTTLTGLMVYGADEGKGPLAPVMSAQSEISVTQVMNVIPAAHADDDWDDGWQRGGYGEREGENEFLEEFHEFFANFTILLIMIHLVGVFVESTFHRESLVRAMLTGYKRKSV